MRFFFACGGKKAAAFDPSSEHHDDACTEHSTLADAAGVRSRSGRHSLQLFLSAGSRPMLSPPTASRAPAGGGGGGRAGGGRRSSLWSTTFTFA